MKAKNKSLVWGIFIGSIVGSAAALLFAPKSGKDLRQDIAEGARQVGGKVQEVAGKVGEQGVNLIGVMTDRAEGVISDIQAWRHKQESWKENENDAIAQVSSCSDGDFIDIDTIIVAEDETA